jgi:DNA invertase Pin-like site-specific DNA recombinase
MSAKHLDGVSYSRFSNPSQAAGDSEDRQARDFRRFCKRHHLNPQSEVYVDRGLSGYKDEHRKKGELGVLIIHAKEGQFKPGTVIVVEAWDHLGRLRPDKQTELIAELLRTGVSIGVCRLDDIFTEADFGTHKWTTLAVFVQLAYQESKQKSERLGESWDKRRQVARESKKPVSTRGPAWLQFVNGNFRLIPERAATVKRIFSLAANGYGHGRIVKVLTEQGVPTFGVKGIPGKNRTRTQFSGHWTRDYVRLILNDRRAVGDYQPCNGNHQPLGDKIGNYFPAAVTEQEFLLACHGANERKTKHGEKTVRQAKYLNIFAGLLRNAEDGGTFLVANKGQKGRPNLLLVTLASDNGRGKARTFPYLAFREAILKLFREITPKEILAAAPKPDTVDVLEARLSQAKEQVRQLKADLSRGYSPAITEVLREKERLQATLQEELDREKANAAHPAERDWAQFANLHEALLKASDQEDALIRLRSLLQRRIDSIWLLIVKRGLTQLCAAQVWFRDAELRHRNYLIVRRAATGHSSAFSKALSLAEVIKPGDLDLRQPAHARRLEAELARIDVAQLWESLR